MRDQPSDDELQRMFCEHGIPRRHLFPLRCRIARAVGLRAASPIRYSLPEHFLYEGLVGGVLLVAAAHLLYLVDGTSPRWSWPTALIIALTIPVMNWLRYRGIRKRLGLPP